jgi:hypothetical protein
MAGLARTPPFLESFIASANTYHTHLYRRTHLTFWPVELALLFGGGYLIYRSFVNGPEWD